MIDKARLADRVAVVTGASAGVGAAAARQLARLGATVVVVGRSPAKTAAVAADIGAAHHVADFSRLADVRALAEALRERHPRIDILANNAGGRIAGHQLTEDGHEMTFQVNYLAPFLLTRLLTDRLAESPDARVIATASAMYTMGRINLDDLNGTRRRYQSMRTYANWKLANILFTRELAKRSAGTSVTAAVFHPGVVRSEFFRDGGLLGAVIGSPLGRRFSVSPEDAGAALVHLAAHDDPASINGAYFRGVARQDLKGPQATDDELARRLWERTADLLG